MLENLTDIPLFLDLSPDQIALLDPLFEHIVHPPETVVFEQGEQTQYLYILTKGTIAIRYKPYDGPAIILTNLHRGDVFGWSAVVGSKRYTSGAISVSQVEIIRISGQKLWYLVREHPEMGKVILNRLADVVSSRWENARAEVQALFDKASKQSRK